MSLMSEARNSRALPFLLPVAGLLLLLIISAAFGRAEAVVDSEAFIRSTLFEIKSLYAVSSHDAAFETMKPDLLGAMREMVMPERLEPRARRFLAATLVLLGQKADGEDETLTRLLAPDHPSRPWLLSVAAGEHPEGGADAPDLGTSDPWFRARLRLLASSGATKDSPEAHRDETLLAQMKDRAAGEERAHLGRVSSFFGMGFLLFMIGTVTLFRLRVLLATAAKRKIEHADTLRSPPRIDGRLAIRLWLFWLLSHLALAILLPPLLVNGLALNPDGVWPALITYIVDAGVGLTLLWVYVFGPRVTGRPTSLTEFIQPARGMEGTTIAWATFGPGLALVLVIAISFFRILLPEEDLIGNPGIRAMLTLESPADKAFFLLNVAVIAPFFEEILFRGFVYNQARDRFGIPVAVSLSATLFAFVHFSLGSFLPIYALGVVLALAYEASGNLTSSILIHGIWNGVTAWFVLSVVM